MTGIYTAALQGVVLHFLGASIATLMFGGRVACWMMALASLAMPLFAITGWLLYLDRRRKK